MHFIKLQYSVHYTHILTFSANYKEVVAPLFALEGLKYGFNNFGTFDEGIRLIFEKSGFVIVAQKDACILIFEGDENDLGRSSAGPLVTFLDLVGTIKGMKGFGRFTFHQVQTYIALQSSEQDINKEMSKVFTRTPFDGIKDYAAIFEMRDDKNGFDVSTQFGNFRDKDSTKFDLSPFKLERNEKLLKEASGYLCDIKVKEDTNTINYTKFKLLFDENLDYAKKLEKWI